MAPQPLPEGPGIFLPVERVRDRLRRLSRRVVVEDVADDRGFALVDPAIAALGLARRWSNFVTTS